MSADREPAPLVSPAPPSAPQRPALAATATAKLCEACGSILLIGTACNICAAELGIQRCRPCCILHHERKLDATRQP